MMIRDEARTNLITDGNGTVLILR